MECNSAKLMHLTNTTITVVAVAVCLAKCIELICVHQYNCELIHKMLLRLPKKYS